MLKNLVRLLGTRTAIKLFFEFDLNHFSGSETGRTFSGYYSSVKK